MREVLAHIREEGTEAVAEMAHALSRGVQQVEETVRRVLVSRERGGAGRAAFTPSAAELGDTVLFGGGDSPAHVAVPTAALRHVSAPHVTGAGDYVRDVRRVPGRPPWSLWDEERLVLWAAVGILWCVVGLVVGLHTSDVGLGLIVVTIFFLRDWIRGHRAE